MQISCHLCLISCSLGWTIVVLEKDDPWKSISSPGPLFFSGDVSCRILPSISKSKACYPKNQGCKFALSLVPFPEDPQLQHIKCWRADKQLVPSLGSGIRCVWKANSSCAWTRKKIESKNNNNKNYRSSFGNVGWNICFCLFFLFPNGFYETIS